MYQEIIKKIRPELDKVFNFFDDEIKKIRGARVSPSLVENLLIDYHGEKLSLKKLASITLSGPRTLQIQPWDKSIILNIERAFLTSTLGFNPVVKGDYLEITVPPLNQEIRQNLLRLLGEKAEMARQSIRRWREVAWRDIQEGFRQGKIREDDKFRAKDELQDLIDEYNKKIEEKVELKEKEIME
jgi:ribosome recycling factor